MIRALIFDCFGVLYRDNAALLYDLIPDDKQQDLQDIIHAFDHGLISKDDYFRSVASISGESVDKIRDIDSRQFSRNEPLFELIKPFRAHYKIGLLSNIGEETMNTLFPQPERSELFDSFVESNQFGMTKPAREVFEYTASELGMLPEECIMIDDLPRNIDGAQLAGMYGIVFSNIHNLEIELAQIVEAARA